MSMKLSYRDRVIIIVVAVLVVLGVGIFVFAKPRYEEMQVSQTRLEQKQQERADMEARLDTLEPLKKQLENDVKNVEENQKKFLNERDYGETHKISQYLLDLLEPIGDDFVILGMDVPMLENRQLAPYYYAKHAVAYPMKINADIAGKLPPEVGYVAENNYPEAPPSVEIGTSVVTITYGCEDDTQLIDAIQLIADNQENIYLMTCSGNYVEAEQLKNDRAAAGADAAAAIDAESYPFGGEIIVEVYEIYPLDPDDIKD